MAAGSPLRSCSAPSTATVGWRQAPRASAQQLPFSRLNPGSSRSGTSTGPGADRSDADWFIGDGSISE
ncbi:hypothetical protein [Cyanobium sp. LEGE 06113]|uniref:hypothetical protein n=1 Tax=Cyanobium sp. LEGE 06113 TaxID=1297573 RepID=UPI001880CB21|nr:hypothetical protein [Cyanobium sp. LEGE 06113]MBE9152782.1 hypothetical protein [Cyanobium sp. LEGE 06113]MBE9153013.1 hypothetical protein [Cyanobium sp. LEGE 06113]